MRFYTEQECEEWLSDRGQQKPDQNSKKLELCLRFPTHAHQYAYYAWWIVTNLMWRERVLLWITKWGIGSSTENWHLYHALRHHHGDRRLLEDAPGHLFGGHESADLASFLQVAMLNGSSSFIFTPSTKDSWMT